MNSQSFRKAICANEVELKRFRQLVVNSVVATDIMDKELIALRNARWEKAFYGKGQVGQEDETMARNRKATIVIEQYVWSLLSLSIGATAVTTHSPCVVSPALQPNFFHCPQSYPSL